MRPVNKGSHPLGVDGIPIIFKDYSESRRYLIDKIGEYCSYCESRILTGLAVEHVQPKSSNPGLELKWDNFLLACTNCNSIKGAKNIELNDYVWPDADNTYELFSYDNSGIVKVKVSLDNDLKEKVEASIKLTGLDRLPPKGGSITWRKASDRRFEHRVQAWVTSHEHMSTYSIADVETRKMIIPFVKSIVLGEGFWSIWMTAFQEFPEVQQALIDSFSGTKAEYFR